MVAIGISVFGIGFTNIMVALVVLAVPPMLTNAYVAVDEVDRDVVQAARGMGMHERDVLFRVELPLSLPLIFAGMRTAAVYVVSTATIAAIAGGGGLGDIIVNQASYRLRGRDRRRVLRDRARPARRSRPRRRPVRRQPAQPAPPGDVHGGPDDLPAGARPVGFAGPGPAGALRKGDGSDQEADAARRQGRLLRLVRGRIVLGALAAGTLTAAAAQPTVVIGSKNFTEEYILGELYKQALQAKGYKVSYHSNIGSTEIIDKALTSGQINFYPEYTGTMLSVVFNNDKVFTSARRRTRPPSRRRRDVASPSSPRRPSRTPTRWAR